MTRLPAVLLLALSGCSLLLGDNFEDLKPTSDAGTSTSQRRNNQKATDAAVAKDASITADEPKKTTAGSKAPVANSGKGGAGGSRSDAGSVDAAAPDAGRPDDGPVEDKALAPCPDKPCEPNEECIGSGTTQRCQCKPGFVILDEPVGCIADVCKDVDCGTGGRCYSYMGEAACNCQDGFMNAGGTDPCKLVDNCASDNICTSSEYPCASTVPYYYCQGQFAAWPMPDDYPGAKVTPSFEIGTDGAEDGTVTDLVTHLMWQREHPSLYPGCESTRGESEPPGTVCNWEEAKKYCDDLTLATHSDWRLPTKIELESISTHMKASPALPQGFSQGILNEVWTSSTVSGEPGLAWTVSSFTGGTIKQDKTYNGVPRCVRTERLPSGLHPDRRFVGSDNRTGLQWQINPSSERFDHAQAITYCEQLSENGGGWRLPSVKELMTIVDPTRNNPAIIRQLDAPGVADEFWALEASIAPHSGMSDWLVSFRDGSSMPCCYSPQGARSLLVRCVR